jgi:hypothetical protein
MCVVCRENKVKALLVIVVVDRGVAAVGVGTASFEG